MDITPFTINYMHHGIMDSAEIYPCCKEDNVVDYAVWMQGKLAFTIARDIDNPEHWVVALKNADDDFEEDMVQNSGADIEKNIAAIKM